MQITITGRHLNNVEEARELIEKKLNSALKIFPDSVKNVRIIISKNLYLYSIEALVELTLKHKIIPVICEHKDLRIAIDSLVSKLSVQMHRTKGKLIGSKHDSELTIRKDINL